MRIPVEWSSLRCVCGKYILSAFVLCGAVLLSSGAEPRELLYRSMPHARFQFEGLVGERIQNSVDHWLLPTPESNPGMLEMFRVRDREPKPNLVPWAGEFVGKYLISAIQTLRMTERPQLRALVNQTVAALISTQAEDGYLGPFTREVRLKGNWDLWGHYHCMLALLMWHEATGDAAALTACRRAADLVCNTFLNTGVRVYDAGSHEMNMAIVHALGWLYRITSEPRYLTMMREIEKDWERAGDYLRTGLAGVEFFQTPRPRWESLHDLQGLVEFYRITHDERYRDAFTHHWRSIVRWDRRNTGGFSSGEQATGNPYAATPIETCCTVAWMAMTIDMLQLHGDSRAADELELSFYNGTMGAQHPSGRWCTYNTPMDGAREASAHTIVFQSRAGTPELNCCSVNGPRGFGMLSEWAVMSGEDVLVVNYYGPGSFQGKVGNTPVALKWDSDYPRSERVALRVEPLVRRRFRMMLRIPAWSNRTAVDVNGDPVREVIPGKYLELNRRWEPGDRVTLTFGLGLRAVPGDREALGKVSVYRGPLLMAYDQALNTFDESSIPPLDLSRLDEATELGGSKAGHSTLEPWLTMHLPATTAGRSVRVCDFASAGAKGTRYRSWLPAAKPLPPPVVARLPLDGASIPPGDVLFRWTGPKRPSEYVTEYELSLSAEPGFDQAVVQLSGLRTSSIVLKEHDLRRLAPGKRYWWRIQSKNQTGQTESVGPPSWFILDKDLPRAVLMAPDSNEDGRLISDSLNRRSEVVQAEVRGAALPISDSLPLGVSGALGTDGKSSLVIYPIDEFPDEDYSVSVQIKINELPQGRIGQVCSAWHSSMDDPIRLTLENGRLFARIESGQAYSTPGFPVEVGRWYRVTAVKSGTDLILYVDGVRRGHVTVPLFISTGARHLALGGNPRHTGNEFLSAQFAHFTMYSRALSEKEIAGLASR